MTRALILLFAVFVCFGLAAMPGPAYAISGGQQNQCESQGNGGGGGQGGGQESVITVVTECVQKAVTEATEKYLSEFSEYMQPIIGIFMVLVMTFFGATTLWSNDSMEDRKQKAFALLFKLGAVALFAYNFGGWSMNAFEGSRQLQDVIVNTLPHDSKCQSQNQGGGGGQYVSQSGQQVWGALDCLLGRLMGYGAKIGLSSSIFGLLGAIAGSGTMGVTVGFLGVVALLAFIFFVLRVVYIFLTSYMFIGFLLVISPLTVPTLLHPATATVFDRWWKSLAVAMVMPGVVFAFLCLVMPLIDKTVGSDQDKCQNEEQQYKDCSISGILGDEQAVENAQRNPQQPFGLSNRSAIYEFYKARKEPQYKPEKVFDEGNGRNIVNPMGSGAVDQGDRFKWQRADWGKDTMGKLWRIGYSMIKILIVAFLVTTLMGAIPNMVVSMFQAGNSLVIASSEMPLEDRVRHGMTGLAQKITGFRGGR